MIGEIGLLSNRKVILTLMILYTFSYTLSAIYTRIIVSVRKTFKNKVILDIIIAG